MSKSDILLTSINNFYSEEDNRSKLLNILDKTGGISLRNLEWFITNYAKKNHTSYKTSDGKILLYTTRTNPVWMGTLRNSLIHFVDLRSSPTQFPVHLMKFIRPWHN